MPKSPFHRFDCYTDNIKFMEEGFYYDSHWNCFFCHQDWHYHRRVCLRNLRFLLSVKRLSYIQKKISCTPLCATYFYAIIRIPFLIFWPSSTFMFLPAWFSSICMPPFSAWLSNIRYPTRGIVVIYSGSKGELSIFFRIFVILTRRILLFCSAYGPHIFSKSIWYVTTVPEFNARLSMIRYSTGEKWTSVPPSKTCLFVKSTLRFPAS